MRVRTDPAAVLDYGVPLLPDEVARIESRSVAAEQAMPTIEAYGVSHADEFGGAYLDHERGGVIATHWTGNLESHARGLWAELREIAPGTPVRLQLVQHPLAELEHLQVQLTDDIDSWSEEGIAITAILLDVVNNELEVGVADLEPGEAEQLIQEYGGDRIRVTAMEEGTAP